MTKPARLPGAALAEDLVQPFQVDRGDVRGRLVRLSASIDQILASHAYPEPVANLLGELLVVAAATAGAFKFHGSLSLQTSSDGPVPLMIAEYRAQPEESRGAMPGRARLRGYARCDAGKVAEALAAASPSASVMETVLGKGSLAFNVESGPSAEHYQGIIAIVGPTIVESVHDYFRRSEQIDAALRVDVGRAPNGQWQAGGVLLQRMPRPGLAERSDDDWRRALALVGSSGRADFLNPGLDPRGMLQRMFPEDDVRVFDPVSVEAQCRCSRDRVDSVLRSFPPEEIAEMVVDGEITVTCEFCNHRYLFLPQDLGLPKQLGLNETH